MEVEETRNLVKTSMEEIRGMLSAERVVGEPIVVGGNTIPPSSASVSGSAGEAAPAREASPRRKRERVKVGAPAEVAASSPLP